MAENPEPAARKLGRPRRRLIRTPRDAETVARDWMHYLGYSDARLTVIGPDEGVDVISAEAVAQVKATQQPVGRPVVQQIYGIAALDDKKSYLFTLGGVTEEAEEWADRAGVALFRLDLSGTASPMNHDAAQACAAAEVQVRGWAAVKLELEMLSRAGRTVSLISDFEIPDGLRGRWGIWIQPDGQVLMTRTFAGSPRIAMPSIGVAVDSIADGIHRAGGTFWHTKPILTIDGIDLPFQPGAHEAFPEQVDFVPLLEPLLRISASDVYASLTGPQCDRRVYLNAHGIEGSPPGALQEMLFGLGAELEEAYLARLGDVLDLSDGDFDDRAAATRRALDANVPVIYQAALAADVALGTGPARVVGSPDFVLAENGGHTIQDTKTATTVEESERPDIAAQLRVYGWLYEQTQGRPPNRLEVVAGDGSIHEIPHGEGEATLAVLESVARLKTTSDDPYCAVKPSNSTCPYFEHCWAQALGRSDVVTVPGVSRNLAKLLHAQGTHSYEGLLERHTEESLAQLKVSHGSKLRRVGKRAESILRAAQALSTREPMVHGPLALPAADTVVMFDLEGTPSLGGKPGYIYLWGTAVRGATSGDYHASFADLGPEGDRAGWIRFLEHARVLFDAHGEATPFVHWATYERTQINEYVDRYGDPDRTAEKVLDNLVDLLQVVKAAVTLPVHSYSLKEVEKNVGFERSQEEFGGDWSIAIWEEAVDAGTSEDRGVLLKSLATYNREDVEGLWAVYEWLRGL